LIIKRDEFPYSTLMKPRLKWVEMFARRETTEMASFHGIIKSRYHASTAEI